jgi:hypothetical protein
MVDQLLLGDNSFIGVSHLAQDKAREEAKEARLENKVSVIESAIAGGATGFTFSTYESNLALLKYLSTSRKDLLRQLQYYILVPHVQSYVRRANIAGTTSLLKQELSNALPRASFLRDAVVSSLRLKPENFAVALLKAELAPYLKILPKENVAGILLHEVLTDLVVAFDLLDLITSLEGSLQRSGLSLGFETRNFSQLCEYISRREFRPKYLMTPFNPLGYQMARSKEAVEKAVDSLGKRAKIIAINVLASGAIDIADAVQYIGQFEDTIYAVTSSSTKPSRICQNFQTLRSDLIERSSSRIK